MKESKENGENEDAEEQEEKESKKVNEEVSEWGKRKTENRCVSTVCIKKITRENIEHTEQKIEDGGKKRS